MTEPCWLNGCGTITTCNFQAEPTSAIQKLQNILFIIPEIHSTAKTGEILLNNRNFLEIKHLEYHLYKRSNKTSYEVQFEKHLWKEVIRTKNKPPPKLMIFYNKSIIIINVTYRIVI